MSQTDTQPDSRVKLKSPDSFRRGLKMILTGNTIGERQKDLSLKINDAVAKNIPLEEYSQDNDSSDGNILFKIGLAAKYKNVDYIIEILKSGDGFHISKAIKTLWLYDAEYQEFINPKYLSLNVFPFMSPRMRMKFLRTICKHVKNESQVIQFYEHYIADDLQHIAFKFLINTSNEFKKNMIKDNFIFLHSMIQNNYGTDLPSFLGKNFTLAELYQDQAVKAGHVFQILNTWRILNYLYTVDAEKYLDKLEEYLDYDINLTHFLYRNPCGNFGTKLSKDIMSKHKTRVRKHFVSYYKLLKPNIFCKYTTIEEAKRYLVNLLPKSVKDFWDDYQHECFMRYCAPLINLIPTEEKYIYFKSIFEDKYPGCEFEMSEQFYNVRFYELMTVKEREEWAFRHLANPNKSFLSQDEDKEYLWYRFVNFDDALPEIKKYIRISSDSYKRLELTNILIESLRNQEHIAKLLQYFYERHVNEKIYHKQQFLDKIMIKYPVWEFNERCWEIFNKLLYSCKMYDVGYYDISYLWPAFLYYCINKKDFPEGLQKFIQCEKFFDMYLSTRHLDRLSTQEQKEQIFQYLKQLCVDKIKSWSDSKEADDEIKRETKQKRNVLINFVKDLLTYFKKSNDDLHELVSEYSEIEQTEELYKKSLITLLKVDAKLILTKLHLLKDMFNRYYENPDSFFKLLKNHFHGDLGQDFLNYFLQIIEGPYDYYDMSVFNAAVQAIFVLSDRPFQIEFMLKYAPTSPKIQHDQIDEKLLRIQEAICRFACYSRPPVPAENISVYITGDYVHFCLPMFGMYAVSLPPQDYIKFVNALLDKPVSAQKHGLRGAFKCFEIYELQKLMLNVWRRSKNITLRTVIYTKLYALILKTKDKNQSYDLFEILLKFTLDLNKDDEDVIWDIAINDNHRHTLPVPLKNKLFETAWTTIRKFPNEVELIKRGASAIQNVIRNIEIYDYSIIHKIVNDYLDDMFTKNYILPSKDRRNLKDLYQMQFKLTAAFIVNYYSDVENMKLISEMMQLIISKCTEMWNYSFKLEPSNIDDETEDIAKYYARAYCVEFVHTLEDCNFQKTKNFSTINLLLENIAKSFQDNIPNHQVYLLIWELRVFLITNTVLDRISELGEGEVTTTVIQIFASQIVILIKEYVDRRQFYLALLNDICEILERFVERLRCIDPRDITGCDAKTLTAMEFVKHKTVETMLISIKILPDRPSMKTKKEHEYTIKNLEMFENVEVKTLFYEKIIKPNVVPSYHDI